MATEFALGGALRGAGDTRFPLLAVFIGLFLFRLVPATIAHAVYAGRRYAEDLDAEPLPEGTLPFRREIVQLAPE